MCLLSAGGGGGGRAGQKYQFSDRWVCSKRCFYMFFPLLQSLLGIMYLFFIVSRFLQGILAYLLAQKGIPKSRYGRPAIGGDANGVVEDGVGLLVFPGDCAGTPFGCGLNKTQIRFEISTTLVVGLVFVEFSFQLCLMVQVRQWFSPTFVGPSVTPTRNDGSSTVAAGVQTVSTLYYWKHLQMKHPHTPCMNV